MKILKTWTSTKVNRKFYKEENLVYKNGDYRIYKQSNKSYIYTYKNIAINNLSGLNKQHIDSLVKRERPTGKYSPSHFIYDRAIEYLKKGVMILNQKGY